MTQHVTGQTHKDGHLLDLLITRSDSKFINLEAFNGSLASALTSVESCDDVNILVRKYNENVTSVLNEYAPEVERTVVIHSLRPWNTSNTLSAVFGFAPARIP